MGTAGASVAVTPLALPQEARGPAGVLGWASVMSKLFALMTRSCADACSRARG